MRKGCGYLLVVAGTALVLASVLIGIMMYEADVDAGRTNRAQWEEYSARMEQLEAVEDVAERDSLEALVPQPMVRQGGFATLSGILIGGAGVLVAVGLLGAGRWLLRRSSSQ